MNHSMENSLCRFSRSELLSHEILPECPLRLTSAQAKQCPCKRREYWPFGGIDLRVIECSFPNRWNGEKIIDPESLRAVLVGASKTKKVSDDLHMSGKLWAGLEIKVLGVCGEYGSGKTLFIQGIDPENTRYYDCEMSSGTYSLIKPENKIDVPKLMGQLKPGYTPLDVFTWWRKDVLSLKPGQFSVIAVDTIGDIEQGLADYVALKHADFGFRTKDSFESSKGIFWSAVKNEWQSLLVEIAQRCDTFAFAAHMRDEFVGGSPSGKREPQGKETLMKLASLYLHLGRPKSAKGEVSERPDGIVLKSRLAIAKKDSNGTVVKDANGDFVMVSAMPPRISPATPGTIRAYIATPPNYDKLKKSELVPVESMSDDDRLRLQAKVVADQARIAEAENKRLEQVSELKSVSAPVEQAKVSDVAPTQQAQDATVSTPKATETPVESAPFDSGTKTTEPAKSTESTPAADRRKDLYIKLAGLKAELNISDEVWAKGIAKRGGTSLETLTVEALEEMKSTLWTKLTAMQLEQGKK